MSVESGPSQPPPAQQGPSRGAFALIIALMAGIATVAIFVGKGRIAPPVPRDLEHLASLGSRNVQACLSCHHQGASARPRPAGHTPRQDCWGCHVAKVD